MNNERWQVALHEAGHCCAAMALGGECTHLAIFPDGRGLAALDGLSPFDFAVARAAAAAAEEMLADEPAPPLPEPEPVHARRGICGSTPTAALAALASRFPREAATSDERAIAEYCITGLEHEPPERWGQRFRVVHAVAYRVVADHQRQILTVARALFTRGVLHTPDIEKELGIA